MSVEQVVKLFSDLGFPAGVAIFVLWRVETRLREITAALVDVRLTLARRFPPER